MLEGSCQNSVSLSIAPLHCIILTLEAELRGVQFDGHGEGACYVGGGWRLVIRRGCGSAIDRGACDSSAQRGRAG